VLRAWDAVAAARQQRRQLVKQVRLKSAFAGLVPEAGYSPVGSIVLCRILILDATVPCCPLFQTPASGCNPCLKSVLHMYDTYMEDMLACKMQLTKLHLQHALYSSSILHRCNACHCSAAAVPCRLTQHICSGCFSRGETRQLLLPSTAGLCRGLPQHMSACYCNGKPECCVQHLQ
jgi:hypothetical protein